MKIYDTRKASFDRVIVVKQKEKRLRKNAFYYNKKRSECGVHERILGCITQKMQSCLDR